MNNFYYYLHTNGELIHKPESCVDSDPEYFDSPFVRKVWKCCDTNRETCWTLLIESLALGAKTSRIKELALKWHCDGRGLTEFLIRAKPDATLRSGVHKFLKEILEVNPDAYWEWLAKTPTGSEPDFSSMPRNQ